MFLLYLYLLLTSTAGGSIYFCFFICPFYIFFSLFFFSFSLACSSSFFFSFFFLLLFFCLFISSSRLSSRLEWPLFIVFHKLDITTFLTCSLILTDELQSNIAFNNIFTALFLFSTSIKFVSRHIILLKLNDTCSFYPL